MQSLAALLWVIWYDEVLTIVIDRQRRGADPRLFDTNRFWQLKNSFS